MIQSHHGLQSEWCIQNIPGYNRKLAPTIGLETNKKGVVVNTPHTNITTRQSNRRDARVANEASRWSSSLDQELRYIVDDLRYVGFDDAIIMQVLEQQYSMLDKLNVTYNRVIVNEIIK